MSPGPALEKFNDPRTPPACEAYPGKRCSLHESAMELLCQVYNYMESGMVQPHPDAPGHSHNIKGIRDADGLPCSWCATWENVRRLCTENPSRLGAAHLVRGTQHGVVGSLNQKG